MFVTCKKENDNNNINNEDNCNQDFIIAGDSLSSCCEIIKIDTTFDYCFSNRNYEIDLDNDNIFDLSFESFRYVAHHGNSVKTGCRLRSENPLLEFSIENDPDIYKIISIKNVGDTISNNDEWFSINDRDSRVYLSIADYLVQEDPYGSGDTWIDYYYNINESLNNKYIGIRIKDSSFIKYYWIKLTIKHFSSVSIAELGRQKR